MKRLIFAAAFMLSVGLCFFTEVGLYIAAALLAAALAAAVENIIDKPEADVHYDKLFYLKGEAPVLTFSGSKRLKGEVVCRNIVTGDITRIMADADKARTMELPAQKKCGGLLINFSGFYRYDLLGLTKRLIVSSSEEHITVLPDGPAAELDDIIEETVGGAELDGAREARPDDRLRRVNLKLTHRFGKPYINTYSPDDRGELWLFADCGLGDRAEILAEQICGIAHLLSARGTAYGLALPEGDNGIRLIENTDSETVQSEVLNFPLYKTAGKSFAGVLLEKLDDDAEIIAFTADTAIRDERITIIN